MLHRHFTANFPEPASWHNARMAFTRTCAVWCMVGHMLGLGDRHGENILMDTVTGDIVQIDFACLFDKVRSELACKPQASHSFLSPGFCGILKCRKRVVACRVSHCRFRKWCRSDSRKTSSMLLAFRALKALSGKSQKSRCGSCASIATRSPAFSRHSCTTRLWIGRRTAAPRRSMAARIRRQKMR